MNQWEFSNPSPIKTIAVSRSLYTTKWHFWRPPYNKISFFETPLQKMAFSRPILNRKWSLFRPAMYGQFVNQYNVYPIFFLEFSEPPRKLAIYADSPSLNMRGGSGFSFSSRLACGGLINEAPDR